MGRVFGSESGLAEEMSDPSASLGQAIECAGKDVAEILCLDTVGLTEPGRTFEVATDLNISRTFRRLIAECLAFFLSCWAVFLAVTASEPRFQR